jgi:hypothetical protein
MTHSAGEVVLASTIVGLVIGIGVYWLARQVAEVVRVWRIAYRIAGRLRDVDADTARRYSRDVQSR